ncbi:hypothetical protein [uncultured Bacteroides sp.]|uniref:hypothetical protein n=1 Tax=uncultured Bacteroides sp. TaxID=162156 RepID=UPI0025CEC2D1|nr:hypothetical protein [uncultured Bacteroides sp.]
MGRKLTEKEMAFLTELGKLMEKYNAILGAENDTVCIDIDWDEDTQETIVLPHQFNMFYNLDEVILKNS